uniref:Rho-GAP domain-containing protein n=1 Tax=Anopheles merus TaxID=30066 RepID=A0A1D6TGT3_ANOME
MSSWAQRMHRRAATFGSVVTSCGHPGTPYPHRLEKVKFGVPLEEVCKNDIPGPLLVLILKLNKEAPCRKDVFRAPGNQGAMKKLIHFLQQGRLVNVDNYSVYTIASVLKKFLRKIPGGVFGRDGEAELFQIVDLDDEAQQQEKIHRLLMSLPGHTQRLLVLLFGTFRVIASNSERADTGMTSEALGVSVAPSFFQSCVSDGKTARMKDVLRFKVATKIMKQMIEQFTACDLFGRVNYEYYARVTGRVLRVQDEWICSFRYPPPPRGKTAQQHYALKLALETEKTWLQCECERWGLIAQEESHSTPALLTTGGPNVGNSAVSLGIIPEHSLLESCARLSVSLEGPGIFNVQKSSCSSSSHSSSSNTRSGSQHHMTLDELRAVNRYAESTKSLSYLPQVHERQAARMRTRSEWFLGARGSSLELCHDGPGSLIHPQIVTSTPIPGAIGHGHHHAHGIIVGNVGLSASAESVHQSSAKRSSRRGGSRHGHLHRSSSRRNKENGSSRSNSFRNKANGAGKGAANPNPSSTTTASNNNNNNTGDTIINNNSLTVVQTGNSNAGSGTGGSTGSMAAAGGPLVSGTGRARKQRAVSFEQTSTTTAGTMTTSSSVSGGAAGMNCSVTGCSLNHQAAGGQVGPRGGGVVWHEYASKSLDEKKLLTKQNNVPGDGGADAGVDGGVPVGRRSIVSVCVNDRQLPDSDDDWPMVDQSQSGTGAAAAGQLHAQQLHHHHHHHHHHLHHHHHSASGGNAGTPATTTAPASTTMSSLLHHFKPPRI